MRRGYFLLFLFWAACSTDSMPSITLRGSNTLRGARVLQSFGARGRVCMRFAGGFSGQNFEGEDDTSSSILPCETTTDEEENRESMASDSSTFSSELGWPEDKGGGESAEWEDDDDPGSRRRGTRKGKGGRQRQLARQSREGETNTGGQDDEEGVRNFIKREQARIRETMGVEGLAANEEAARLAHEDFVPHDARMSEVEMEALRNFTWEMDLNSTYQVKITEEGDNPYFMNHLFGDAGEEGGEGGVEDVLGRDLEEKIPAQGEGEENEDDSSGVKLPEWDGQNRFIGSDGVVYIADQRNLDHVDERGFDEDDNIYPFKDLGDRRFIQLLHEQSAKDQELIRELDAAEKRELEETGDVARYNWRKHLDEDGYLRPDCLQKNSTFLRENPWVNRHYVVPSPTPLRWRGRRIDVAEIGGAAAEWDILCNSAYADRATTFTAFRHTGVGCTIMLPHHGSGWFEFQCAPEEQRYFCTPNVHVSVTEEFFDQDLEFHIAATADDVECKLKSTHTLIGNWRAMVHGPRVVVWNVHSPNTEIHLLHDGLMIQGDSGRSMWVRADALHPDRYKQYFINTVEAVKILWTRYNTSQASIWEYVETENDFGEKVYMKVLKHEEAPDPRLRWIDEKTDKVKRQLENSRGMKHDFDRDELVQNLRKSREEAARQRNDSFAEPDITQMVLDPDDSDFNDLVFDEVLGFSPYTPGKGHYDENIKDWVDDARFTNVPQYKRRLPGVDNEMEERLHFERLDELRSKRRMLQALMEGSVEPSMYLWKFSPFYSRFDEQGLPTHLPDGTPLGTVERREIEDEYESYKLIHADYLKVVDEIPELQERLHNDIEDLQQQVKLYDPFEATMDDETRDCSYMGMHFDEEALDELKNPGMLSGELRQGFSRILY